MDGERPPVPFLFIITDSGIVTVPAGTLSANLSRYVRSAASHIPARILNLVGGIFRSTQISPAVASRSPLYITRSGNNLASGRSSKTRAAVDLLNSSTVVVPIISHTPCSFISAASRHRGTHVRSRGPPPYEPLDSQTSVPFLSLHWPSPP